MKTASYILLSGLLATGSVYAEGADRTSISFFAKGSSITPFGPAQVTTEKKELEFFPQSNTAVIQPAVEIDEEQPLKKLNNEEAKEKRYDPNSSKSKHDFLIEKYGDPAKDAPVLAIDSAPGPFKAMMESLQEGDDVIAFQYAKQYVRHLKNVQDRSTRVMSMVGLAQKREGMIEGDEWSKVPSLMEDKALYQKDIQTEQQKNGSEDAQNLDSDIDARAKSLVSRGKEKLAAAMADQPSAQQPSVQPVQAMPNRVPLAGKMPELLPEQQQNVKVLGEDMLDQYLSESRGGR